MTLLGSPAPPSGCDLPFGPSLAVSRLLMQSSSVSEHRVLQQQEANRAFISFIC
jgi:hypothetical protein